MTLILPAREADITDAPRLHALVIGVADYPHLASGHKNFGLKQISSPEPTARAIADWLQNTYRNADKPLASIELLLSFPATDGTIERATMQNVARAFKRWENRCSSNPENIAFFYFCGHGLKNIAQFLLPEDFGDRSEDLWANCINFDETKLHMAGCNARTQLFFVDACSSMSPWLLTQSPTGRRLSSSQFRAAALNSAVYNAAADGQVAFAPTDGRPTYFAQALFKCFEGAGASRLPDGRWAVTSSKLASHMYDVIDRIKCIDGVPLSYTQTAQGDEVIHYVERPFVLTWLDCSTIQARDDSEMSMRSDTDFRKSARGELRPWRTEVAPGAWKFYATFRAKDPYTWQEPLVPPCYKFVVPR